jgi:hypothetical protein
MVVTIIMLGVAFAAFGVAIRCGRAAKAEPDDVWSAGTEPESNSAQSRAKKAVAWGTIAAISCGGCGGCGCGG